MKGLVCVTLTTKCGSSFSRWVSIDEATQGSDIEADIAEMRTERLLLARGEHERWSISKYGGVLKGLGEILGPRPMFKNLCELVRLMSIHGEEIVRMVFLAEGDVAATSDVLAGGFGYFDDLESWEETYLENCADDTADAPGPGGFAQAWEREGRIRVLRPEGGGVYVLHN